MISFDPVEISNNLKKQGGAIPGIRQGRPTSDYISKILNKVNLVGALFLGVIAVLPILLGSHVFQYFFEWVYTPVVGATSAPDYASSLAGVFTFGGTTLLIVVGVAIETFRELEAQLTMRNYKGFLG
jgi:preprotein translocase subunit SecY